MHLIGAFILFLTFFIIMAISPLIRTIRYNSYTGITEAIIIKNSKTAVRRYRDLDSVWWTPTYEYRVNNEVYYYQSKIRMFYPPKVGKRVKLHYDINNPEKCEVLSKWMWHNCLWVSSGMIFAIILFIHHYL